MMFSGSFARGGGAPSSTYELATRSPSYEFASGATDASADASPGRIGETRFDGADPDGYVDVHGAGPDAARDAGRTNYDHGGVTAGGAYEFVNTDAVHGSEPGAVVGAAVQAWASDSDDSDDVDL